MDLLHGLPGSLTVPAHSTASSLSWHFHLDFRGIGADSTTKPTCGTIAYLIAQALLGLQMSHPPFFCTSSSCSVGPWMDIVGFGPNPVATQLAALLVTKGVPCQQAPDRAEAAIKKLGVTATQAALQNHNPCCQATGIQTGLVCLEG